MVEANRIRSRKPFRELGEKISIKVLKTVFLLSVEQRLILSQSLTLTKRSRSTSVLKSLLKWLQMECLELVRAE